MTTTESMPMRQYREEQVRWVSGHRGSSYSDIFNVIAVSLVILSLLSAILLNMHVYLTI
jgi:hypothetical protein